MKQDDVKTGESYLFYTTDVEHRKSMIGTVVTIASQRQGRKKFNVQSGIATGIKKSPRRFRLTNGQTCNAGELKPKQND